MSLGGSSALEAIVKVRPDFTGFSAKVRQEVTQAMRTAGQQGGEKFSTEIEKSVDVSTRNVSQKLSNFGNRATVGLTLPIVGAFGMMTNAAADLGESVSANGVIFGDASKQVQTWAEDSSKAFGLAKQEALDATNSYGGMLTALGFAEGKAAEISQQLVERAADVGSQRNLATQDVLDKFRSAMTGEGEAVKALGVDLTQAAVASEAFSLGLSKVDPTAAEAAQIKVEQATIKLTEAQRKYGEDSLQVRDAQNDLTKAQEDAADAAAGSIDGLSQAEKAQVYFSLILKGTEKAAGDFGNTLGESLPNQMKQSQAELKNTSAELGQKLLPTALKVVQGLNKLIDKFSGLSDGTQKWILIGMGAVALLGPISRVAGAVGGLVKVYQALRTAAWGAAAAQEAAALTGGGKLGKGKGLAGLGLVGRAGAVGAAAAVGVGAGYAIDKYGVIDSQDSGDGTVSGKIARGIWDAGYYLGINDDPWNKPGMANGGQVRRGGLSWVGERGPELMHVPTGASVLPLDRPDLTGGTETVQELRALRADLVALLEASAGPRVVVEGAEMDERKLGHLMDRQAAAVRARRMRSAEVAVRSR